MVYNEISINVCYFLTWFYIWLTSRVFIVVFFYSLHIYVYVLCSKVSCCHLYCCVCVFFFVIFFSLLKLFTRFIGTIFEKFSSRFLYAIVIYSIFHGNSFRVKHCMFAFLLLYCRHFMCITGIKSFFIVAYNNTYTMLYDLIWWMFSFRIFLFYATQT